MCGSSSLASGAEITKASLRGTDCYGDNWLHVLLIEKTFPPEEVVRYPICLGGCVPFPRKTWEGLPGYENFLEAMRDPKHPEHTEYLEWIGGRFDPEAFDVDEVNRRLRRLWQP